jgi:uncharacterized membrane protein YfcA
VSWYTVVAVLVVGFGSGVLSGMFGIGGAVVTTPGIRALGATPIEAIGSTVPAILPGAISGTVRYARAGVVNWRVGLVCGAAGSALAIAGAWVADVVDARALMVLTAAILGWSGVSIFRSGRTGPLVDVAYRPELDEHAEPEPEPEVEQAQASYGLPMLLGVGAAAGFMAGLLGVGGGIVMVPAFTSILRIPIKEAVASSLVAVALFSIPALVTHVVLGHVNWTYALLLAVGVVPGAQVGSRLTLGSSDRTVRTSFGAFLVVVAIVYGGAELLAL